MPDSVQVIYDQFEVKVTANDPTSKYLDERLDEMPSLSFILKLRIYSATSLRLRNEVFEGQLELEDPSVNAEDRMVKDIRAILKVKRPFYTMDQYISCD
jgi:hypothetical protein